MVLVRKDWLEVWVWFKDEVDGVQFVLVWIVFEVYGGLCWNKLVEFQFRVKGILFEGKYVVFGVGVDLDCYGNIRCGQVIRVLSGICGFSQVGYNVNVIDSRWS